MRCSRSITGGPSSSTARRSASWTHSGLSTFLRAQSFARHHDGDVVVARPSRSVLLVLEVTGLDRRLTDGGGRHDG